MLSQVLPEVRTQRVPLPYAAERTAATHSPYGLPVVEDSVSSALSRGNSSICLSKSSLDELDRIQHTTAYPEGALIFVEGQAPRGVYVLCQGRAKLMATNSDGKTFILKIAEPGEILGLHSAVTGLAHELTVETLQPSQLAFIARSDFTRFLREHGDACFYVAQQISSDCQSAYEVIRSIGLSNSVAEKLARLVLQWAEGSKGVNGTIRLKVSLTHEEIAQLIGTTRESVTRILSQFKKRRIMEVAGSTLHILNKAALEKLLVC
jgi:CRP/FNR family cyclic AMP-dependent transcriptional regulator